MGEKKDYNSVLYDDHHCKKNRAAFGYPVYNRYSLVSFTTVILYRSIRFENHLAQHVRFSSEVVGQFMVF